MDTLTVTSGELEFQLEPPLEQQIFTYNVEINDENTNSITLQAMATGKSITIDINGRKMQPVDNTIDIPITISEDDITTITIEVSGPNGRTEGIYTIRVSRTADLRVRVKVFLEGPLR